MSTVRIPPTLRAATGGAKQVEVPGGTVREVVAGLVTLHPNLESQLIGPDGDLNRFVNAFLNDTDVRHLEALGHHRAAQWRMPPLVCGDFNTPSHLPDATATLLGWFEQTNNYTLLPKTGHTFPSAWPARALDYVFLPEQCRTPRAKIVRSLLSDHQPVLVEFGTD